MGRAHAEVLQSLRVDKGGNSLGQAQAGDACDLFQSEAGHADWQQISQEVHGAAALDV